jgi:hypothetical protein
MEELLISGEQVNIREAPGLEAKVIRKASYEKFRYKPLAKLTQTEDGLEWVEIILDDDRKGFVATQFTTIHLRKELSVAKINGSWKIFSFSHIPGC